MKTCSKCKITKEVVEFVKAKKESSGYASACKECNKLDRAKSREATLEKRRAAYMANKKEILARNKVWREENDYTYVPNKETKAINDKKYYKANREEILNNVKEYATKNSDRVKKTKNDFYKTPKGKLLATATRQKRRGLVNGTDDGTVTTETLLNLKEEQKHKCYHCGEALDYETPRAVHLDHLVPLAKGGQHTLANVRWACDKCNLSKGAKL